MMPNLVQTGRAAAASGLLMLVGVEGEWLLDPQTDDGTVTDLPVFALLVLLATLGFALLLVAVAGLRGQATPTRPARVGQRLSLIGAGLVLAFGAGALVSSLVTGQPWEPVFVAFLVGMLLLAVGPITWGLSLRRHHAAAGVWQAMTLAGLAAFAALATEADPWHDVALSLAFVAWSALGVLLLRRTDRRPSELAGARTIHGAELG